MVTVEGKVQEVVSGILHQGHPWPSGHHQSEESYSSLSGRNGSASVAGAGVCSDGPQTVATEHDLNSALSAGAGLGRAPLCTALFLLEKKYYFNFKKASGKQTFEKFVDLLIK